MSTRLSESDAGLPGAYSGDLSRSRLTDVSLGFKRAQCLTPAIIRPGTASVLCVATSHDHLSLLEPPVGRTDTIQAVDEPDLTDTIGGARLPVLALSTGFELIAGGSNSVAHE